VSVLSSLVSSLVDKLIDLCSKYDDIGRPAGSSNLVGEGGSGGNAGMSGTCSLDGIVCVPLAAMLSGAMDDLEYAWDCDGRGMENGENEESLKGDTSFSICCPDKTGIHCGSCMSTSTSGLGFWKLFLAVGSSIGDLNAIASRIALFGKMMRLWKSSM
jgi:hypothetical protein